MAFASRLTATVRPVSDRIIDGALVAYALWTATCHAVMLLGGNVHVLAWATGGTAAAVLLVCGWVWRRRRAAPGQAAIEPATMQPAINDAPAPDATDLRSTVVLFVLAGLVMVQFLVVGDRLLTWVSGLAYLAVACALSAFGSPGAPRSVHPARIQEIAVFALAALCGFLALYAHRWRNDDCYYINLAVAMVDHPDRALLSINTIHAPSASAASAQVFVPYRVHSFEALGGLLSYLTGVPAISVIHLWLAAAFAALMPLALARLFRLLDPARWLYMLLAALCLLLFEGSSGLGFANQGIVRMFTGKSVLLAVVVPLIAHHGLAFGLAPTRARFGLLLAAQISAVGLSSTALWLAPLAAMLAVIAALRPSRAAVGTLLLGLLSCVYVVALALWVRAQLMAGGAPESADDAASAAGAALAVHESEFSARFGLVNYWLRKIFEAPRVIQASLGLLLLAIPAARTQLARRYMALFGFAVALLFVNPYIAEFMRHNVLGAYTGQRGLWLAPLPAAVAIVFTALVPARGGLLRRAPALLGAAVALLLFFYFVPTRAVFSRDNDVAYRWPPGPRVPVAAFALGERLSRELPKGSLVLAPEVVSWYLPTIHDHAFPVLANAKYLRESGAEENRREKLVKWVSDHQPKFSDGNQQRLIDQLAHYQVAAVVLSRGAAKTEGLVSAIKRAGFTRKKAGVPGYRLYLRRDLVLNSGG